MANEVVAVQRVRYIYVGCQSAGRSKSVQKIKLHSKYELMDIQRVQLTFCHIHHKHEQPVRFPADGKWHAPPARYYN